MKVPMDMRRARKQLEVERLIRDVTVGTGTGSVGPEESLKEKIVLKVFQRRMWCCITAGWATLYSDFGTSTAMSLEIVTATRGELARRHCTWMMC